MRRRSDALPARVQEALGELAGAAKEGLLALSVGVGLGVLAELMEDEVEEVVGPKGKHDADRTAVRHGHDGGEVTLGGRRVPVERPRARAVDGSGEVELASYRHFADRDPLTGVVLERMLAGVSTRATAGPASRSAPRSTSRPARRASQPSAASRCSRTREHLIELMSRPLDDLRLAVLMLDGIELKGRCCVVALGIDSDGVKHPLGLWDGSTENATVATTLLANLVERGLDVEQGVLVVLDGAKALRKAVRDVLGHHTPVQRCIRHKERNVLDHLAERDRPRSSAGCARRGRSMTTPPHSNCCNVSPASSTAAIPAPRRRSGRVSRRPSRLPALPWTLPPMFIAPIAGMLAERYGNRPFLVCGLALQAAGYAWVASIAAPGVEYLQLGAACTIAGIGTSFCFPTVAGAVMSSVPLSEAGVASGANSAIRELGGVVGVAVLASVFINHGGYHSPQAFFSGFTAAIWVAVALSAIGVLAAIATGGRRRAAVDQADVAQLQPQPA